MANRLYVANLDQQVTESQLLDLFSLAGEVMTIELPVDLQTHRSRGYGFVHMATEASATEAIKMFHQYLMLGRRIIVSAAIRQG